MYTSILVICVISLAAFGRTTDNVISSECREQFITQTRLRDLCHNQLTTPNEFYQEFNTTVIEFSSGSNQDVSAVEIFFAKYCSIIPQFLQCFDISDDVTVECRTQIPNRQVKTIVFQVISSLAHYACADDAAVLKKLLPHNGFRFFFMNDDFDRCVATAKDFQSFNDLCSALDRSLPCIVKTIGDHPNKDIIVIARESLNRFKSAANCYT